MLTTPWHRLDPETTARSHDLMDSHAAGTRVPAATRAEIRALLQDRLRRGEVVAVARLRDGKKVFLGSPVAAAARVRQGLHAARPRPLRRPAPGADERRA
ncbi:hypothetical protein E2C06_34350 [Dankookia rubra]|uniref:Uncharacterized protein n=1 Tax=Dankookia rubra TaxID=1442381 RepID=A0A4R5Q6N2_9PROT|nr:hypothetical protein [Dankookia rubra]TDH58098.1 hypothetical protein E2C06_34350 [Dankookia rubra]